MKKSLALKLKGFIAMDSLNKKKIYIHILTDKALYTDMTKLSYCSFGYSAHINNHHNIIVRIKEAYFLQASLSQAPYQMFNMQCHILFG